MKRALRKHRSHWSDICQTLPKSGERKSRNVQLRHSVDSRTQHHDEPYAANVPGGISNVSPSANRVENVGEILRKNDGINFVVTFTQIHSQIIEIHRDCLVCP